MSRPDMVFCLPSSRRVDQGQGDTCQTGRAWEAHELSVDALRELAADARVLSGSAGRACGECRELRVQPLCVDTILQSEGRPPNHIEANGQC